MLSIAKRTYTIADDDLIQLADDLMSSANRDLTDLSRFGVTTQSIAVIQASRDAFQDFPNDMEMSGLMAIATRDKNLKREELRVHIIEMVTRCENKFGSDAPELKLLAANSTSTMTDGELSRCGFRVHRRTTDFLSQLSDQGLTQPLLDDLFIVSKEFDDAINTQFDAIKERDVSVDKRIKIGNELYALLSKLANSGKVAFQNTNEAKYNDYVLSTPSQSNIQRLTGVVAATSIANPSVSSFDGKEKISIQILNGPALIAYCSANPFDEPGATNTISISPGAAVPVNLAQLGFNKDTAPRLLFKNNAATPSTYFLEIEG